MNSELIKNAPPSPRHLTHRDTPPLGMACRLVASNSAMVSPSLSIIKSAAPAPLPPIRPHNVRNASARGLRALASASSSPRDNSWSSTGAGSASSPSHPTNSHNQATLQRATASARRASPHSAARWDAMTIQVAARARFFRDWRVVGEGKEGVKVPVGAQPVPFSCHPPRHSVPHL